MEVLKRFGKGFFHVTKGALILIGVATVYKSGVSAFANSERDIIEYKANAGIILNLLIDAPIPEIPENDFVTYLRSLSQRAEGGQRVMSCTEIIQTLEHASKDSKIKGILCKIGPNASLTIAQAEELRNAITEFKLQRGDCPIVAVASNISSNELLMVTSSVSKTYVQPNGIITATGYSGRAPFFKQLLQNIGVDIDFIAREEYKNAISPFLTDEYNEFHYKATKSLIDNNNNYLFSCITKRIEDHTSAWNIIQNIGFMTASTAQTLGLIDVVGYYDQAETDLKFKLGDTSMSSLPADKYLMTIVRPAMYAKQKFTFKSMVLPSDKDQETIRKLYDIRQNEFYKLSSKNKNNGNLDEKTDKDDAEKKDENNDSKSRMFYDNLKQTQYKDSGHNELPKIALLYACGPIVWGNADAKNPSGRIHAYDIIRVLDKISKDDDIKGIVIRINSPGGDAIASDAIHHALLNCRKKGKVVVVSMASVAASGGYYMACAADKVFADRTTITGSIGVFMAKPVVQTIFSKIGITMDDVDGTSELADTLSLTSRFSAKQLDRLNIVVDEMYVEFINKVCEGRKMTFDEVRQVAKGRLWSGNAAVSNRLVDEIGGISQAIRYTINEINDNSLTGVGIDPKLIVLYPDSKGSFAELLSSNSRVSTVIAHLIPSFMLKMILESLSSCGDVRQNSALSILQNGFGKNSEGVVTFLDLLHQHPSQDPMLLMFCCSY